MHTAMGGLLTLAGQSQSLRALIKLSAFKGIADSYGVDGYDDRPSFRNPNVSIHSVIQDGCRGFATKISALHWQGRLGDSGSLGHALPALMALSCIWGAAGLIMGGLDRAGNVPSGNITRAAAVQNVILLGSSAEIAARLNSDEGVIIQALQQWRDAFLAKVHGGHIGPHKSSVDNFALSSVSAHL